MKALKTEYKDLKYEIAGKDDSIQRLKAEIEGLRADLKAENGESKKCNDKIRRLTKKLDKATTKNAKLQSQIDEFEDRVTDSVARPLYNELQRELEDYRERYNEAVTERDAAKKEISTLTEGNESYQNQVDKLTKENETFRDEMNQLTTHNTFWKNKVKSMREEIKKLHSQPVPSMMLPSPPPVHMLNNGNYNNKQNLSNHNQHLNHSSNSSAARHSVHQYSKSDNELCDLQSNDVESETSTMGIKVKEIEKERDEALAVVSQLKRALNHEHKRTNTMSQRNKIMNSISSEEWKTVLRKNAALKSLANELADTVADKEQNIKHLKEVLRLLGNRVSELEKTNKSLRGCVEIDELQNAHDSSPAPKQNGHAPPPLKNGKVVEDDSCDLP